MYELLVRFSEKMVRLLRGTETEASRAKELPGPYRGASKSSDAEAVEATAVPLPLVSARATSKNPIGAVASIDGQGTRYYVDWDGLARPNRQTQELEEREERERKRRWR